MPRARLSIDDVFEKMVTKWNHMPPAERMARQQECRANGLHQWRKTPMSTPDHPMLICCICMRYQDTETRPR